MSSFRSPISIAHLLAVSLGGFLLVGVAYADEKDVDENGQRTFAVKSDVRIQIELVSGDIEIKADGKVTIEGQSVSISPSPCKCG